MCVQKWFTFSGEPSHLCLSLFLSTSLYPYFSSTLRIRAYRLHLEAVGLLEPLCSPLIVSRELDGCFLRQTMSAFFLCQRCREKYNSHLPSPISAIVSSTGLLYLLRSISLRSNSSTSGLRPAPWMRPPVYSKTAEVTDMMAP